MKFILAERVQRNSKSANKLRPMVVHFRNFYVDAADSYNPKPAAKHSCRGYYWIGPTCVSLK